MRQNLGSVQHSGTHRCRIVAHDLACEVPCGLVVGAVCIELEKRDLHAIAHEAQTSSTDDGRGAVEAVKVDADDVINQFCE
jgi:hypothetical protein